MILQGSWILWLALCGAWVVPVSGGKGLALGDRCFNFDDCGDFPKSFILCVNNICQCSGKTMYYEHSKSMCVSYIGEKCDAAEPTDAVKVVIHCGENAFCQPSLEEKFGECRCNSGYKRTSESKCAHMSNSRLNSHVNHHNHPKYGGHDGNEENSLNSASMNEIVSFPFSSANAKPSTGSKDSLKSHTLLNILLLLFLSIAWPYMSRVRSVRVK